MNKNLEKRKALQIIGKNIKRLRVSRNMTQEQLAERLERSINFVSLIELGKSGMSVVTILEICNILEVDVNCLFKGLVEYNIKDKDQRLINNILTLSSDDKDIIEKLIEHLINKL